MKGSDFLPEDFNAAEYFVDRNVAAGRGGRLAVECGDRRLSYADLLELVNRAGNALRELGIEPETRILLACLDGPEFLAAFWGAIKIGAVPVPVNTLLRSADYRYLLRDSRARAAVVSHPILGEVAPAIDDSPFLRHVLVADGPAGPHVSFEEAMAKASARLDPSPTSRDDVAFWLYSSGSTGAPKATVHLQHDMPVCAEAYAREVLAIREDDRIFSAAKLFFGYGLGNAGYFPPSVGAASILVPGRPTAETTFDILTRTRPTLFFGVPTLYASMLACPDAENRWDLSSLRLCVSAGEALPAELYRRWRDRFDVEILDGIGTTEVLHIFLSNRQGRSRPGSSGVPVPGFEVAIVDDDGRAVPRGEIGNLRVRGDSTMALYWNQHDKTKEVLLGSWIQTGDKYTEDEDGFFWYCGRSDDMLKVGGIWVSPIEVEAALIGHAAVLEAAVVGHDEGGGLVKPRAFVVLKDRSSASAALAEELKAFIKERLAPYKYPRWVEFVEELPKTATGKIQRFRLRALGASLPLIDGAEARE